jgi:hypothetical protein
MGAGFVGVAGSSREGIDANLPAVHRCTDVRANEDELFSDRYNLSLFKTTTTDSFVIGYILRKHIANALKARSVAIRTALDRYNAAALALIPCQQVLDWDQVVEYAFLSDFDLLHEAHQDICRKSWATLAACLAIDQAFKLKRAEEEVARLNIEIPRLAMYSA